MRLHFAGSAAARGHNPVRRPAGDAGRLHPRDGAGRAAGEERFRLTNPAATLPIRRFIPYNFRAMKTSPRHPSPSSSSLDRRRFMGVFSALGLSSTLMPGVLWAAVQETKREPELPRITKPMIDDAAEIAGVEISDADKDMMLNNLNDALKSYKAIYDLKMPNSVPPAVSFNPVLPGMKIETAAPLGPKAPRLSAITAPGTPKNLEDAAFYTVRQLAELVRTRKVSSTALTQMYLERLKRYDPKLHFVVTLTEDRALAQAKQADADIAVGKYRGQLHGLPWGAKDLLAVKNYPTTWGAHGFEEQKFDDDATVVKRLDAAGAVLVAKTTLGALALGDFWQGHDG